MEHVYSDDVRTELFGNIIVPYRFKHAWSLQVVDFCSDRLQNGTPARIILQSLLK